ncbi:MAG: hypothetical protein MUC50_12925 [Myxococcota bacterium]|jgi:C4-dicarboxylate-specific signal transduction histidine kinase|nr:hypothetical protein [Myxococcota bacterium]
MTDVTAQRELEQQLYHAQKMDAIGRLAGGVAHDFNNLLSVIISYGEFLMESSSSPEAKADAAEIVKAGHRAAGLTRQLLVFSRKQTAKPSVISPNKVVDDLSKMLSRLVGEKHKLRLSLSAKPGCVYFDKAQLDTPSHPKGTNEYHAVFPEPAARGLSVGGYGGFLAAVLGSIGARYVL